MSILTLAFNRNTSLLTCGTNNGFLIYKLDPYIQKHSYTPREGGICTVKILEKTNILTLVPETQKNTFILWDQADKKNELEIDMCKYYELISYINNISKGIDINPLKQREELKLKLKNFPNEENEFNIEEYQDSEIFFFSNDNNLKNNRILCYRVALQVDYFLRALQEVINCTEYNICALDKINDFKKFLKDLYVSLSQVKYKAMKKI